MRKRPACSFTAHPQRDPGKGRIALWNKFVRKDSVRAEMRRRHKGVAVVYVNPCGGPDSPAKRADVAYQRAQAGHARAWGWPAKNVRLIVEKPTVKNGGDERPGYCQLISLITAGRVGLVLVSRLSRLTRSPMRLISLLRLCTEHDVALVADGIIETPFDPANSSYERLRTLLVEISDCRKHLRNGRSHRERTTWRHGETKSGRSRLT
jgi:DNA invertase Pin-like site-specific DNA recombinase